MLENVIGVEQASEKWELSAGYIKNLCAEGKIKSKKIGKTWVIDGTQEKPNSDLTNTEDNIFTSKNENQFFIKSKYKHIEHDFNYKALADITSDQFAEKIKDSVGISCYVKTLKYHFDGHFTRIYLYAEGFRKEKFLILEGVFCIMESGGEFSRINIIDKMDFDELGMTIAYK